MEPNFTGYATRYNQKCSDGRTILPNAFAHNDGIRVPLVWSHEGRTSPSNILGYAILKHVDDGMRAAAFFNESPTAQDARISVEHGDITSLSIMANDLQQNGLDVHRGNIRELSLVMAGANPGAFIENVSIQHGDEYEVLMTQAIIFSGEVIEHAAAPTIEKEGSKVADETETTEDSEETVRDVVNSMNEKQQATLAYLIDKAVESRVEDATEDDEDEDEDVDVKHSDTTEDELTHSKDESEMTRNVFEQNNVAPTATRATLTHDQMSTILADASRMGSLKASVLSHAGEYGITDIELLFPDARTLQTTPEFLKRRTEWVNSVLSGTKHTPFSKIKSLTADITGPEARARGYVKGAKKVEEVLQILRRTTGPTTVYKKQKLDRDDILDITDFDVLIWLKAEMRLMLEEELARAILMGDGRSVASADKIKDPMGGIDGTGIRSIANENELYAITITLSANVAAHQLVDQITRSRSKYRGSGNPTLYTTADILTDMLMLTDKIGRRLYPTVAELASTLRVSSIVEVEPMADEPELVGIIVNLTDYSVGTNKGGETNFFSDFDIDYNQEKYLLETRLSGALTKPHSALVFRRELGTAALPTGPSFDGPTNTITVPTVTGIDYLIESNLVTGTVVITEDTSIVAVAKEDYYIPAGSTTTWHFQFTNI